jgi:hypothetical protein
MALAIPQDQRPPTMVPYPVYQQERELRRKAEAFIQWENTLFSNPNISGNHKLEIRATRYAVQRAQTHDDAGRARINQTTIAQQIGVSPDTMSRGLKFLKQCGVIADHDLRPEVQENGERWTRHYIKLDEELLQRPHEIHPPAPRNHGGQRYTCQKCGSDKVKIKKRVTLVCKCGHVSLIEESERDQVPESDSQEQAKNFSVLDRNLQDTIKPVTPPYGASCDPDLQEIPASNLRPGDLSEPLAGDPEPEIDQDDLHAAAELLLALAGQADEHIEMSRRGEKKYYTVDRRLNINDVLDHLAGGKARGANCSYPDGQTRGLCFDADEAQCWELLEDAAQQLAQAGYLPILEPSPGREVGGHLWIIYTDLVNADVARRHVYSLAPQLADIAEYWPGPQDARRWNRVRLPGAKYVRPGVSAWCQLFSVATGESSQDGRSAATLLLGNQTPAAIVPAIQSQDDQTPDRDLATQEPERAPLTLIAGGAGELGNSNDRESKSNLPPGQMDTQWEARYNTPEGKRLWFAWTPAQLAAWWNKEHDLEKIRPREKNKMALSPNGEERTASTAYYSTGDGERWTDFSTHGRRADGTQDTGDALELEQRLTGIPKPELMREIARKLLAEARQALEDAARSGQALPIWLEEFITDAGRERYAQLAERAGHIGQAAAIHAARCNEMGAKRNENMLRIDSQAQASTSAAPAIQSAQDQQGGVTGFLFPLESTQAGDLLASVGNSEGQGLGKNSALAVPDGGSMEEIEHSKLMKEIQQLDEIKVYAERYGWPALEIDGVEIIAAGRPAWLRFIWLAGQKEQQRRVYQHITQAPQS